MKNNYPITHYEYMVNGGLIKMGAIIVKIKEMMGTNKVDFMVFANKLIETDVFNKLLGYSDIEQANMVCRMTYHIWRMNSTGEKIYHISKNVCDLLLNTKLTIDAEFIESPFEEIYLYTDQEKITMTDCTGTRAMKGVYVNVSRELDGIKKVRFLATSGSKGIEENKDVNHFACFHIPEHGDLEDICNDQLARFREQAKEKKVDSTVDENNIQAIFKFVVNALIYIGCRNAELSPINPPTLDSLIADKKSSKKISKIKQKYSKSAQKPFIFVTHNTLMPKHGGGEGKRLDHEVMVGGYWRGQWYGSRNDGTRRKKVIRIDSYTKGIGLGDRENKQYKVK